MSVCVCIYVHLVEKENLKQNPRDNGSNLRLTDIKNYQFLFI